MLISYQVMKTWASALASWILTASQSVFVFALLKKFAVALLTCIFALGTSLSAEFSLQFLCFLIF